MYSLTEIKRKVAPIAKKHRLAAVYLFGSYARGEATETSDVDLLIDSSTSPHSGLSYFSIHADLERSFGEDSVDIVDMKQVTGKNLSAQNKILAEAVLPERILIYG
ncbi:MAG: nucleotidyltransferase domain-containing protein [Coriobacteriia bacterium]|nr:nucleotidyltransferase domain-containing protein [Coriobacteriia bacterium]